MSKSPSQKQIRQLDPLPKGITRLYGFLAVLLVIIPEWLAEWAIVLGINEVIDELPAKTKAWKANPELLLAELSIRELRELAKKKKLIGYSSESKDSLTKRLLKGLRSKDEKKATNG